MALSLTKPAEGTVGWAAAVNQNFTDIEAALASASGQLLRNGAFRWWTNRVIGGSTQSAPEQWKTRTAAATVTRGSTLPTGQNVGYTCQVSGGSGSSREVQTTDLVPVKSSTEYQLAFFAKVSVNTTTWRVEVLDQAGSVVGSTSTGSNTAFASQTHSFTTGSATTGVRVSIGRGTSSADADHAEFWGFCLVEGGAASPFHESPWDAIRSRSHELAINSVVDLPADVPRTVNDEFDEGTLSGKWSAVNNAASTTWTVYASTVKGHGRLIGKAATKSSELQLLEQASVSSPASGDAFIAKLYYPYGQSTNGYAGIYIRESSTGEILTCGLYDDASRAPALIAQKYNSPSSFNSNLTYQGVTFNASGGPIYLRFRFDGTNWYCGWSSSGDRDSWFESSSDGGWIGTATLKVGLMMRDGGAAVPAVVWEFFREYTP